LQSECDESPPSKPDNCDFFVRKRSDESILPKLLRNQCKVA
jgi:hypothetical protein